MGDRPIGWIVAHAPIVAASAVVALVALTAYAGYQHARRTSIAPDDRARMTAAEHAVDSLRALAWRDEARPPSQPPALSDDGVIALAYVARADRGIGSPFRIAAFAMRDPRLPATLGRTAAWAVLARTARGATYSIDTMALSSEGSAIAAADLRSAIARTVARSSDARTGEAAVRIGYALAASEASVSATTTNAALRAAAQLRDRRLAAEDARRLLRASAADEDNDALSLLAQWRVDRRLLVEQPLLGTALRVADAEAAQRGIAFRDELRALAARRVIAEAGPAARGLLPPRTAARLAELPSVRNGPPLAPVAVPTAAFGRQLEDTNAAVSRRFADRARSEESLVAELALADAAGVPAGVARVALTAAVAMRAFAQDTLVPFADYGPTLDAVRARFGLRAVTFDRTVPAAWRPYYLAQLSGALENLRLVLPWAEFDGLAVRFGESVKRDSALALHDPGTRTIYLPAATGAGTMAHELAHDLDWQTSRSRLAARGTYSTDRAVREGSNRMALSVRGLATARSRTARDTIAERPAELFARGVDWYVAMALASSGRSDGALTAVQDETLAGYAGVVPPQPGDGAAEALVEVLGDMTVVPGATRDGFLARYGAAGSHTPSATSLLRLVSAAGTRNPGDRLLHQLGLIAPPCPSLVEARDVNAGNWRVMLTRAAAESRARGFLKGRSRWAAPARWSWEARAVDGGPWSGAVADSAVARMRDGLLRAARTDDRLRHPLGDGVLPAAPTEACR